MHFLHISYRILVASVVGALVSNYYGGLTGVLEPYELSSPVYYGVIALALGEPLFWAFTHLCGGVLMGIAAGGIWDGIKLALTLGVGLGIARAWPSVAASAAAVYVAGGPLLYSLGGGILALGLYGLDKAMTWMWHHAKPETGH
jgi:hypothetical protein